MKRVFSVCAPLSALVVSLLLTTPISAEAQDDEGGELFFAKLVGFEETPMSLSSPATGSAVLKISEDESSIHYVLSYEGFGPGDPFVAHIHFGQRATSGGVAIFLCGGGPHPQACPEGEGMVTGDVNASDVVGPAGQEINPGDFDKVIAAIRAGFAYANVHTKAHMGGEIRGQFRRPHRHHGDGNE